MFMNSTTNLGSSEIAPERDLKHCVLSVIIVTWNVKDLLRQCLRSLQEDDVLDLGEVIVVDNASKDGTGKLVEDEFPRVKLLKSSENVGFSRANNFAIRESKGEFVLLLNPDTVVQAGSIRKLVEFARQHTNVGAMGPKLYAGDGTVSYEGAVDFPKVWNIFCDLALLSKVFPRSRFFCGRKMGYWNHETDREVPAVSGAAMLVKREVFNRIGVLNETLFYAEDMDFCLRVRRAGWSIFYLSSAAIIHYGGGSTSRLEDQAAHRQIAYQSSWLYTRENRGLIWAMALSAVVALWSLAGIVTTSILALACGPNTRLGPRVRYFRRIAMSLLKWAVSNKKRFRHNLAAPPVFGAPKMNEEGFA